MEPRTDPCPLASTTSGEMTVLSDRNEGEGLVWFFVDSVLRAWSNSLAAEPTLK